MQTQVLSCLRSTCLCLVWPNTNQTPDAAFTVVGDFNWANLRKAMPNLIRFDFTVFLIPEYQRSQFALPITREVKRWTDQSEDTLRSALDGIDWEVFRTSTTINSEFTDVVISFLSVLVGCDPTVIVMYFSRQKPWVDRTVRVVENARTTAYQEGLKSGDMTVYKVDSYEVR